MNLTCRKKGYQVVDHGVLTGKVVYWYDPEEYEEHQLAFPEKGKPDRTITSKWFRCDVCGGKFPIQDYNDGWDWGGPHCPNPKCGNGGMELFAEQEGPIRVYRGVIVYQLKKMVEMMESILGKKSEE